MNTLVYDKRLKNSFRNKSLHMTKPLQAMHMYMLVHVCAWITVGAMIFIIMCTLWLIESNLYVHVWSSNILCLCMACMNMRENTAKGVAWIAILRTCNPKGYMYKYFFSTCTCIWTLRSTQQILYMHVPFTMHINIMISPTQYFRIWSHFLMPN